MREEGRLLRVPPYELCEVEVEVEACAVAQSTAVAAGEREREPPVAVAAREDERACPKLSVRLGEPCRDAFVSFWGRLCC